MNQEEHYLEHELRELLSTNETVFGFLEAAGLDGIWYWDLLAPEHRWMSPRFWEVLGYQPESKKHLASEWQEILVAEDADLALESLCGYIADSEGHYDQVIRFQHQNGSTIWIRCRGVIIRDAEGTPIRMLGTHSDISEYKRAVLEASTAIATLAKANVALRDSRETIEAWPSAMFVWQITDSGELLLSIINAHANRLFASDIATVGQPIAKVAPDIASSSIPEIVCGVDQYGVAKETEFRCGQGQGERWYLLRAFKVRDRLVATSFLDVTQQRRAERELLQSNEDLEQFAYVASHDLQEPLRAVMNFTQLLADRHGDALNEEGTKYLGHAFDGARRMHALINDLLGLFRIGATKESFRDVDLELLVQSVITRLEQSKTLREAQIHCEHLPVVLGDVGLLSQVFENLLTNAIKFNDHKHADVTITSRLVDERIEISVRDNGIGIAPRHSKRVFEMFQRLHKRSQYPGTGIGLAIVAKVIRHHGGNVWAESAVGTGSTFRFTLPIP